MFTNSCHVRQTINYQVLVQYPASMSLNYHSLGPMPGRSAPPVAPKPVAAPAPKPVAPQQNAFPVPQKRSEAPKYVQDVLVVGAEICLKICRTFLFLTSLLYYYFQYNRLTTLLCLSYAHPQNPYSFAHSLAGLEA